MSDAIVHQVGHEHGFQKVWLEETFSKKKLRRAQSAAEGDRKDGLQTTLTQNLCVQYYGSDANASGHQQPAARNNFEIQDLSALSQASLPLVALTNPLQPPPQEQANVGVHGFPQQSPQQPLQMPQGQRPRVDPSPAQLAQLGQQQPMPMQQLTHQPVIVQQPMQQRSMQQPTMQQLAQQPLQQPSNLQQPTQHSLQQLPTQQVPAHAEVQMQQQQPGVQQGSNQQQQPPQQQQQVGQRQQPLRQDIVQREIEQPQQPFGQQQEAQQRPQQDLVQQQAQPSQQQDQQQHQQEANQQPPEQQGQMHELPRQDLQQQPGRQPQHQGQQQQHAQQPTGPQQAAPQQQQHSAEPDELQTADAPSAITSEQMARIHANREAAVRRRQMVLQQAATRTVALQNPQEPQQQLQGDDQEQHQQGGGQEPKPPAENSNTQAETAEEADSEEPNCVICKDKLRNGFEALALECGHVFHESCVNDYATAVCIPLCNACPYRCHQSVTVMMMMVMIT